MERCTSFFPIVLDHCEMDELTGLFEVRVQVKSRVEQLELQLSDDQVKDVTAKIKELADVRTQSMDDVDTVLRVCESLVLLLLDLP